MNHQIQIVHGGSDKTNGDFTLVHDLAKTGKSSAHWGCGKDTKKGDDLLIYFEQPHSAIVARAVALRDATPGKYYRYDTRAGKFQILSSPITLEEMKEMFPRWKWLNYPRAKQYLDKATADALLNRASRRLSTPPVDVKVSGAGFGNPEQNRVVEKAACLAVRTYFERLNYEVISRETEKLGYDFDAIRNGEKIHIEVKGISGSVLRFPITANEVDCARNDQKFRLAVVTEAVTSQRKIHIFSSKDFRSSFGLRPLAYFAEPR